MQPTPREQLVVQKVAAVKKSSAEDVKMARWELAKAVFDHNNDGVINDKDVDPSNWRYGLGIDKKTGLDIRDEVATLLDIKDLKNDESIKKRIDAIKADAALLPNNKNDKIPENLNARFNDYKKALADKTPDKISKAEKALIEKFFDFDENGKITGQELDTSIDNLKKWKDLIKNTPDAPSVQDIEIIEKLVGIKDAKGNLTNATSQQIMKSLERYGLKKDESLEFIPEKSNPLPKQQPNPKGETPMAEASERNVKVNKALNNLTEAKTTDNKNDIAKATTAAITTLLDIDGDGKVTTAEVKIMADAMKKTVNADKNQDGKLDAKENEAIKINRKQVDTRPKALFEGANILKENGVDLNKDSLKDIVAKIEKMGVKVAEEKKAAPDTTPKGKPPEGKGKGGGRGGD